MEALRWKIWDGFSRDEIHVLENNKAFHNANAFSLLRYFSFERVKFLHLSEQFLQPEQNNRRLKLSVWNLELLQMSQTKKPVLPLVTRIDPTERAKLSRRKKKRRSEVQFELNEESNDVCVTPDLIFSQSDKSRNIWNWEFPSGINNTSEFKRESLFK